MFTSIQGFDMTNSRVREVPSVEGDTVANYPLNRMLKRITPQSPYYWIRLLLENSAAVIGMLFLLTIFVLTFTVPMLSTQDLDHLNPAVRLQPPSSDFLMGTDHLGRDVLLRSIYGVRVSLSIGLAIMLVSALLGTTIGLVAGYYPRLDTPIMRIMDGIMAFPPILLAIAIMASLGPRTSNVVVALGVVYIPVISRLVRGSTLTIKQQPYVEAARSVGARDLAILRRHVFPNSLSPLIVQCTFVVAFAIIAESALSFLGAGVPPEVPTWGSMLRDGQAVIGLAWWMVVVPGAFLFLTVLSLNMIGDGLRDAIDPRSRGR
jgi:peptide/nickel transport system permease protein